MRLGSIFYFAIVYFVIVSLWAIGEAIVYDCAVRLLFLNNFTSPQSRKQGRSLRGTASGEDYKRVKLFKVSDRDL